MANVGFREWLAIGQAIASKNLLRYGGKFTDRFEQRFGKYLGAKHVLTVQSGTGALQAALAAAGIGPGDEVLVPAYTWMATAAAPVMVGAVPIMVDIDESLTIDPKDIERKITPYTRAIIPVHMVNAPCDMDAIMKIAKKHNLVVIEDACQSVGIPYKDRFTGAIGHLGALSFNQYKNINVGEGGAVVTNDDRYFARARNYHDLGSFVRNHEETFNEPTFIGGNMRATEIDGAMLGVQLDKLIPMLAKFQARRKAVLPLLKGRGFKVSPHHSPDNAMTLTVIFDKREDAIAFSKIGGVYRLQDNSKHVYTNWEPILSQRAFHPKMNPWAWANRPIEYSADMCAKSLDILERTCRIKLDGRMPTPVLVHRMKAAIAAWNAQGAQPVETPIATAPMTSAAA